MTGGRIDRNESDKTAQTSPGQLNIHTHQLLMNAPKGNDIIPGLSGKPAAARAVLAARRAVPT